MKNNIMVSAPLLFKRNEIYVILYYGVSTLFMAVTTYPLENEQIYWDEKPSLLTITHIS